MEGILNTVLNAGIPNILTLAGIAFLLLAVIGNISGKFEPGNVGRIAAGALGGVLLTVGLVMYGTGFGASQGSRDSRVETATSTVRPTTTAQTADTEAKARAEAEEKARADTQSKALADAEAKRRADTEAKALADADVKRRADAEAKVLDV
jgi:hypothetical protein